MTFKKSLLLLAMSGAMLTACSEQKDSAQGHATPASQQSQSADTSPVKATESTRANQLFDEIFDEGVARSPMMQTYLGIKKDYGKWDDISEQNVAKELDFSKQALVRIQSIDTAKLDSQTLISYNLLKQNLENEISDHQWRFHTYPVNQMFGIHSQVPAFLINQHSISNVQQAQDYISRVQGSKKLMQQLVEQLKQREQLGIIAPKFVFKHVIRDSNNILMGAPFEQGGDSTLLADFMSKINKLTLTEQQKQQLGKDIKSALIDSLKPGYQGLVAYLTELEGKADNRDGAWKFPQGEAFFNNALKRTTTTDLTSTQIHQIGLEEVQRIHSEMRGIMEKVGFELVKPN